MFEFDSLLGFEKSRAIQILNENGYNDVVCKINSKQNDLCDSLLVCKIEYIEGKIFLTLGEFYLKFRGN